METVDRIIIECIDSALSSFSFVNKEAFYHELEETYGVKPTDIGQNLDIFANLLRDTFGINSFKIQTKIIRIMKERTKNGIYASSDEVPAFLKITQPFVKLTEANIRRVKSLTNLTRYSKELQKKVQEADEKLKANARLAAIGATAGMVGHDIRNPLQSISSELYFAKKYLQKLPDSEFHTNIAESLDAIEKDLLYINKIVQDLQDYARELKPEYKVVVFSDIVSSIFDSVDLPSNIKFEINGKDGFSIETDPVYFRRIITNLVSNAVQAMPKGGKLTFTACKEGNRLYLYVADTGEGIPEAVKPKLFTPLMTTKSKGQGLGLAVSKRLVEAMNGKISFESAVGVGTKFIIELPLKKEAKQF